MGAGAIFKSGQVATLKDILRIGSDSTAPRIVNSTVDPTSVATAGDPGSLLLNRSSGVVYKKDDSGTTTNWTALGISSASESSLIENLGIDASVAASALTVAIKQSDGSTDATSGSPVRAAFRGTTLANGDYNVRSVTGALSMVVSSGSTLGHGNNDEEYIYVYLLDNAGTPEVAVSSSLFDDGTLQSTTAEGGAGGADSASVLYSTTARSNVPIRLVARLRSVQTTAGTWAAVPEQIQLRWEKRYTLGSVQTFSSTGGITWTRPEGCVAIMVHLVGAGGGGGGTPATAGSTAAVGQSGSAGGYARSFFTSGFGPTETVTIGAGGAGGVGAGAGANGGNSTFLGMTANGGSGGTNAAAASLVALNGLAGGGASGGNVVAIEGGGSGPGLAEGSIGFAISGAGGDSFLGAGGRAGAAGASTVAGDAAAVYGGGGSGACSGNSQSGNNGGAGEDGYCIIEEYY